MGFRYHFDFSKLAKIIRKKSFVKHNHPLKMPKIEDIGFFERLSSIFMQKSGINSVWFQ